METLVMHWRLPACSSSLHGYESIAMKPVPALLLVVTTSLVLSLCPSAVAQKAPADKQGTGAKLVPGCNKALLDGEFHLSKAPDLPCKEEQKAFIEEVIEEVKGGYGGTMVGGDSPHPHMDTPEFTALFLRAFADPGKDFGSYDYCFERLMARVSEHMPMMEDARLDWDMWRAWLLFENTADTSGHYKSGTGKDAVWNILDGARELLWNYLNHNAPAILKDEKRRAWWITQLTRDLEAPGGRTQRRWFLLALVSAADPKRQALEKIPMKEEFVERIGDHIQLRQPHPLDPFLILSDEKAKAPPFGEALAKMAAENQLALEVLDLDPAKQPATQIHKAHLEMTKWQVLKTPVINQESWSKPDPEDRFSGHEWGVQFYRSVGQRAGFSSVNFPADRTDGVFFFVFNQRLYVWPKAKMDAAVIQMLHTAKLVSDAARADYGKRGFPALKATLVKEPVK